MLGSELGSPLCPGGWGVLCMLLHPGLSDGPHSTSHLGLDQITAQELREPSGLLALGRDASLLGPQVSAGGGPGTCSLLIVRLASISVSCCI